MTCAAIHLLCLISLFNSIASTWQYNNKDLWKWCPYPRWWHSVCSGWWSTATMHSVVSWFYTDGPCTSTQSMYVVQKCIWWLWKYECKIHDTSEIIQTSTVTTGVVTANNTMQLLANLIWSLFAECRTGEQLQYLPCNWRYFDCSESCSICYHQLICANWWRHCLIPMISFILSQKKHEKKKLWVWNIRAKKERVKTSAAILFIHAILYVWVWCNITSLWDWKRTSLREFKASEQYVSCTGKRCAIFSLHTWCKALVLIIYNGMIIWSLDSVQH